MRLAALTARLRVALDLSRGRLAVAGPHHTCPSASPASLFERLQHLLRLATQCPAGPTGDDIRRGACEVIEGHSSAARHAGRRRMLKAIARAEWRRSRGQARDDDPNPLALRELTDAARSAHE